MAGQTLRVEGPPVLCQWGLHGSRRALDALRYAPGLVVSRVRLEGMILEDHDKAVATERHTVWVADAREVVIDWAQWCAWGALWGVACRGGTIDPRTIRALQVGAADADVAAAAVAAWATGAAWADADAARLLAENYLNTELERDLWALRPS